MSDTRSVVGLRAWLSAHVRRAMIITVCLAVGGAVFVVVGSFVQVWFDVGWVPLDELHTLQYGDSEPLPGIGDFWGIMAIGVVVVPAILGGAGLGEVIKRWRGKRAILKGIGDAPPTAATLEEVSWSSAASAAVARVTDRGSTCEIRDKNPLGRWQVRAGSAVSLWTTARGDWIVGTGEGVLRGTPRSSE